MAVRGTLLCEMGARFACEKCCIKWKKLPLDVLVLIMLNPHSTPLKHPDVFVYTVFWSLLPILAVRSLFKM